MPGRTAFVGRTLMLPVTQPGHRAPSWQASGLRCGRPVRTHRLRVVQKPDVELDGGHQELSTSHPGNPTLNGSSNGIAANNIVTHGIDVLKPEQSPVSEAETQRQHVLGSHAPQSHDNDAHLHFMRPHEPIQHSPEATSASGDLAAAQVAQAHAAAAHAHHVPPHPPPAVEPASSTHLHPDGLGLHEHHPKQHIHLPKPGSHPKPLMRLRGRKALICVGLGLAVRWLLPIPTGVAPEAWTLLSVFVSTIAGLVLEPLPVSAWSLCCVTTLLLTKAVDFKTAMSGLTNDAIWLIVVAFFFAKVRRITAAVPAVPVEARRWFETACPACFVWLASCCGAAALAWDGTHTSLVMPPTTCLSCATAA